VTIAAQARVLLLIDAVSRAGPIRVSDVDLTRLAYFVDSFSPLWGLPPLDRFRVKLDEPRSAEIRSALNRLVLCGIVEPSDVRVVDSPRRHLSAHYVVVPERADRVLAAITATEIGRREKELVEEVVFAASGMLDGSLGDAVRSDAAFVDPRVGHMDLIDLASPSGAWAVAQRFRAGASSNAHVEAELTHLYLAHIERMISRA
jgi:hypothetical protein